MPPFEKPRVVVSKCLGFSICRYDGLMIQDAFVEKLLGQVEFIPVCPEVEIGLGVPRDPIRVVEIEGAARLLQPSTGRDVTAEMDSFSKRFLGKLRDIDGFLLKGRSPSCGITDVKIYDDNGAVIGNGAGLFTRAVRERFPEAAMEDEGRLGDPMNREYFLIRIFTLARFRAVRDSRSLHELKRFQAENTPLFLAYNQTIIRELESIAANPEGKPAEAVMEEYGQMLPKAFARACGKHEARPKCRIRGKRL